MSHLLHEKLGKVLYKRFGESVKRDRACKGKQLVQLFNSKNKEQEKELCMVDMLILKNDKVKIIIEIEESNIAPLHILGKFLASALSSWYIYKSNKYPMDDSVSFFQIIDTSKLKEKTSKTKQCENIENSIKNIIPIKGSKIQNYMLFTAADLNKIKDAIIAEYNS